MSEYNAAIVHVIDDDSDLGAAVARLLVRKGYRALSFVSAEAMLKVSEVSPADCVVTDVMMDGMDGFDFAEALRARDPASAIIFMTAWPTTANAVDAIRRYGGLDYLEKPIDEERLVAAIAEGVAWSQRRRTALGYIDRLTAREKQVLYLLAAGMSNKMIAAELELSPKTIEDHRAAIMTKTGSNGMARIIALVRDAVGGG